MFVILVMATATVIPVMLLNKLDANSLASFLVSLIACSALMTRSSLAKSLHSPYPYKSGARGEPILPPATLVSYTIRFSMWSGFYGLLMYSLTSDILIQLGLMALAVVWSLVRMKMLNRKFATKPEVRNKIIFTVASN